jgi:hypothetical protein
VADNPSSLADDSADAEALAPGTEAPPAKEPYDYPAELDKLVMLVRLAANLEVDLDRLRQVVSDADTVMPFLDPTAWMQGEGNLRDQSRLLDFAVPFIVESRKMMADARAGQLRGRLFTGPGLLTRRTP